MRFLIFFAAVGICISGLCRNLPVLDPNDPQFAWMDPIIERDFSNFKRKISWADYARVLFIHKTEHRINRFQIINNSVHGPKTSCYRLLEYLCRTYGLPDLDFLYWNQDGIVSEFLGEVPILTGIRKIGVRNTILFGQVWIFDITNPHGPWNSAIDEIDENKLIWNDRQSKLFWRGTASDVGYGGNLYSIDNWSHHVRGKACALSKQHPDLIDAAFTHFQPFLTKDGEEGVEQLKQIAPFAKNASIAEHLRYKYQFQAAGIIGNFPRDVWQLYSESTCFRHDYADEVYWSDLIKPWEHYIPVKISMDDLIEKIEWAKEHDQDCFEMALRAREFVESHVLPEHIALFCYKVLLRYAKMQGFDPRNCPL